MIGTGGALTRLPDGEEMLEAVRAGASDTDRLLPPSDARILLDRHYVFAACGALASRFPAEAVVSLMRASIGA